MSDTYKDYIDGQVRPVRIAMDKAGTYLTDAQASTVVDVYPLLAGDGSLIKSGTRINWRGQLMRAAVDLYDREGNWPDAAPALWEEINYHDGVRIIPEVITAGLAFAKDELGYWPKDGKVYKSLLDANVYTPEAYAAGWEEVTAT